MSERPHGIWPILYAFFGRDGALDRAAMRRQVQAVLAAGAPGMAVMGLATEVGKLSPAERRQVVEWAAEDLGGRIPLAVTIFGATPEEQSAAVAQAAACGAAWVVLQPPRLRQSSATGRQLLAPGWRSCWLSWMRRLHRSSCRR